jgi:TRAP-type mannitol/chloroaromatic compound transport system permease large subunit
MKHPLWFGLALMAIILVGVGLAMPAPSEMTQGHLGLLMLALVVVAIMLGFPTAFTLMGMGVIFTWLAFDGGTQQTLDLMVQRAYGVMSNDVLMAVPLFVFMGYLVERANLIEKLFRSMHLALARVPGSLAVATIATCALFATATGIVGAVVTLMGLLAFPAMLRAGYSVQVSAGAITAGGCLGILIPPSVLLIVYGATAGVSVVQLYAGALFPGLMLALLYVLYVVVLAKLRPRLMPPLSAEERRIELPAFARQVAGADTGNALPALWRGWRSPGAGPARHDFAQHLFVSLLPLAALAAVGAFLYVRAMAPQLAASTEGLVDLSIDAPAAEDAPTGPVPVPTWLWITAGVFAALLALFYRRLTFRRLELFKMLLTSFFPLALLIGAVLGSIVAGLATPAEAAAMGSFGGLLLAAAYGQLRFSVLKESVFLTAKTSAMVCWLFVGSSIFSAAFALLGGQGLIEQWVLGLNLTPVQFMILAQLIIFLLGWPLEWTEIIVIFMPIFIPLLAHFHIDPLFFGLLVAVNLQTAFLSPPVAMAAFYLKGVAPPHVTLNQIFAGMLPFMAVQIVALVLLYVFPDIALWLPRQLYP